MFPTCKTPYISVILVLHNKAALSLLSLVSVYARMDVEYELIIVDNHSTDETERLLRQMGGCRIIRNRENIGFGEACMQAAAEAQGEHLFFLNNDAILEPDAVQAALNTLRLPNVGAVGGKILLADGHLQEAGSILWQNGSALGFGRGDNPQHALYEFRRPVDYCSGAFLFTPRELFAQLGGFERCYSPAYYEDADYCMKVWSAGYRVLYEPRAVIRHYESASTEGSPRARDLMQQRRTIFRQRWAARLKRHLPGSEENTLGASVSREFRGLRILYIDDRVPHAHLGSGFGRSKDVLDELVRLGHQVTLVPFAAKVGDLALEYVDIDRGVELFDFQCCDRSVFWRRVQLADVVWISRPPNQNAFLNGLMEQAELRAKLVYDAEAIFSERETLFAGLRNRHLSSRILAARKAQEIALASAADAVTVVSKRDQVTFTDAGVSNVHVVSVSLRTRPTHSGYGERHGFLFVGATHSRENPNADSMMHFCRYIWPKVHEQTKATFLIAGYGTDKFLDHLGSDSVEVLGEVNDLDALYDQARVFVIPTRYSAGIPTKAYEAAAFGVPMVVSGLIGQQLGWANGSELLVAQSDDSFIRLCCRLYSDERVWRRLRVNALTKMLCEYNRAEFGATVAAVIDSLQVTSAFGPRKATKNVGDSQRLAMSLQRSEVGRQIQNHVAQVGGGHVKVAVADGEDGHV